VGKEALQQRIDKSKDHIKNKKLKERPKEIIATALKNSASREDFEKQLQKQGISVLFRENESGRIYGATFIDHKQRFVFNGSRLGKEFSANVFHQKFNPDSPTKEDPNAEDSKLPDNKQPDNSINNTPSFENLSRLFGIESRGENYEEEDFIRRMKRKKRRKRKL